MKAVTPAADLFPPEQTAPTLIYAWDREETDACEAGTPGCSIDHTAERTDSPRSERGCASW